VKASPGGNKYMFGGARLRRALISMIGVMGSTESRPTWLSLPANWRKPVLLNAG